MNKLLLVSVLLAIVVFPAMASGDPVAVRGLKRLVVGWLLFCVFYALGLSVLYIRV